uniref:Myb-like domain-containing protein n=1 Tax=viral metagenome TaxID=1070528 RepID=A0A6C0J076_9ZZZZ
MFNSSINTYYKNYYNDNCVNLSDDDNKSNENSEYKDKKELKNDGKIWTKEDDKYLLKLVILDYNYKDISDILERTEDAIKARFVKKVLCKKYTKKTLNDNFNTFCKSFDIKRNDMIRYITYVIPSFELKEIKKNRINFM